MLNRAEIIGRVGKSEVRYMPNGDPVANFTVAATEKWNDKQSGQPREKTEWFNCVAYNPLADIIGRYVDVGDLLYIDGKSRRGNIRTRTVTTATSPKSTCAS